jgi:hypothetical protein
VALTSDEAARLARLLPYRPWLADASEADQRREVERSLYRPAYVSPPPNPRGDGRPGAPPWSVEVDHLDVIAWRARNLDERWATPDAIARCLTWLELEFSGGQR